MARTIHVFDLLIIGGGTAGLAALREARRFTDNVLLINDGPIETTCARVGCMPSKALLHAAKSFDDRREMKRLGVDGVDRLTIDIPQVLRGVRESRDFFVDRLQEGVDKLKYYIIDGRASFESETRIRVGGKLYHARSVVVTTGSTPIVPQELRRFGARIHTSDTIFEQADLPRRIAVIGMGPMGLELGQAFAMLGCKVIGIQQAKRLGRLSDDDIHAAMVTVLERQMTLWLGADPSYEESPGGIAVAWNGERREVDALFVAVGRSPNLASIGLDRLGLPMRDSGVPDFHRDTMRVGDSAIYLAGDASEKQSVLHQAQDEGRRAAYYACGGKGDIGPHPTDLHIVFTRPNIAMVGRTGREARDDPALIHGDASFTTQGRARIEHENVGKLRIFAERATGRICGAEILAFDGEHHAHFLALAIQQRLSVGQMLEMPFYHPTTEEGVLTALRHAQRKLAENEKAAR